MAEIKKKHAGGRPKEKVKDKVDLKLVEKYASLGLNEKEIAYLLDVDERTISNWKKDEEFLSVIKNGKVKADAKVIESCFKRANGYSYEEVTREAAAVLMGGEKVYSGEPVITKIVTKHIAADPAAFIFWLTNRRKGDWKRNDMARQELKLPEGSYKISIKKQKNA
jgi:hypothetical protein